MPNSQRWATDIQDLFLAGRMDDYKQAQSVGSYQRFWSELFLDWEVEFPTHAAILPGQDPDNLSVNDQVILEAALKKRKEQLRNWYRWRCNPRARGAKDAPSKLEKEFLSARGRIPHSTEVYSKMCYDEKIKPVVEARIKAEKASSPSAKPNTLNIVKAVTREMLGNELPEVREQIECVRSDIKAKRSALAEANSRTAEDYASALKDCPTLLGRFLACLSEKTGWAFSVLMGGPDPRADGQIKVVSYHTGLNAQGQTFAEVTPQFEERFSDPYSEYLHRIFPPQMRQDRSLRNVGGGEGSDAGGPVNLFIMDDNPLASSTAVPSGAPTSADAPLTSSTVPSGAPTSADAPIASSTAVPSGAPTTTGAPPASAPIIDAPNASAAPFVFPPPPSALLVQMSSAPPILSPSMASGASLTFADAPPVSLSVTDAPNIGGALFVFPPAPGASPVQTPDAPLNFSPAIGAVPIPASSTCIPPSEEAPYPASPGAATKSLSNAAFDFGLFDFSTFDFTAGFDASGLTNEQSAPKWPTLPGFDREFNSGIYGDTSLTTELNNALPTTSTLPFDPGFFLPTSQSTFSLGAFAPSPAAVDHDGSHETPVCLDAFPAPTSTPIPPPVPTTPLTMTTSRHSGRAIVPSTRAQQMNDIGSKSKAMSTSTIDNSSSNKENHAPSLIPVPPSWLLAAETYLVANDFGSEWTACIKAWRAFEAHLGYTKKTMPQIDLRPEEWAQWITKGRNGMRPYDQLPTIGSALEFGTAVMKWWCAIQPAFRQSPDAPMPLPTYDDPENPGCWEALQRGGPNGMLSVLTLLSWWGQSRKTASQWEEDSETRWIACVVDVRRVLERIVSGKKRGSPSTSTNVASKKAKI